MNQPRHIPINQGDIVCSDCGLIVEAGDGRRYRMKYRHFHCLPPTRLAQIDNGEKEASRTRAKYAEATDMKKIEEEETEENDE